LATGDRLRQGLEDCPRTRSTNDLTLKQAALKLEYVTEAEFDKVVDPSKMVHPYVATE